MKAILTYHSIDDTGSPISVPHGTFRAHLRWLTSGRVRPLSLADVVAEPDDGRDAVAVTFDDGFLNSRESVQALLSEGVPVTIFAVAGHVGGTNAWGGREQQGIPTWPLLDWGDLERLMAQGASVESHTRTHPSLVRLSPEVLQSELAGCADDLHRRLGVRPRHVAYPFGDFDPSVLEFASQHYERGFTTVFRVLNREDPGLCHPRLDMYYFRKPGEIEAWGAPAFTRRLAWVRTRRRLRAALLSR